MSAVLSIRTLPTTAFFGPSLLFFYLLAAGLFLIPIALISAELSSTSSGEGGVFYWMREAFGDKIGVLAVWLQWINTMVWYPTMLLFVGGTLSYLFHPTLAENRFFLLLISLLIFWALTFLNLKGIKSSIRLNAGSAIVGTLFPIGFLIFLGLWWALSGNSLQIPFSVHDLTPSLDLLDNSNALVTIMASLLGMELSGVHITDILNPQKTFPRAVAYSTLILLGALILGSLSIAFVVPQQNIHFVDGVMQTFTTFLTAFKMPYLVPLLALLISIGAAGGSINWMLSPAKGLEQIAGAGFLPPFFKIKNQNGVPGRILILQAGVVTLFSCAMHLTSSVNTYYWFLMALSTGLYMLMYILLFLGALKRGRPKQGYQIPKGLRTVTCLAGIFSCILTLIIGFQPAPNVALSSLWTYFFMAIGGFILMLAPVALLWRYRSLREKKTITTNLKKQSY